MEAEFLADGAAHSPLPFDAEFDSVEESDQEAKPSLLHVLTPSQVAPPV